MTLSKTVIDGIECLTVIRENAAKTAIILHGFGADMNDLAPLYSYLDPSGKFNWIFPNGIDEVPIGPHMAGRAWFPIRMAEIEAAAMRGDVVDFADVCPPGLVEAEIRLKTLIKTLRIKSEDLVLGGFSQGAMMTCQIALTMKEDVAGMLLFSGNCINLQVWSENAARHRKIPFIQSHGTEDPVLGFKHAERLYEMLTNAGLKGEFIPFKGFHEIPLPVIREAAKFLDKIAQV
jgi:phospholipase/carboxylesterase